MNCVQEDNFLNRTIPFSYNKSSLVIVGTLYNSIHTTRAQASSWKLPCMHATAEYQRMRAKDTQSLRSSTSGTVRLQWTISATDQYLVRTAKLSSNIMILLPGNATVPVRQSSWLGTTWESLTNICWESRGNSFISIMPCCTVEAEAALLATNVFLSRYYWEPTKLYRVRLLKRNFRTAIFELPMAIEVDYGVQDSTCTWKLCGYRGRRRSRVRLPHLSLWAQ